MRFRAASVSKVVMKTTRSNKRSLKQNSNRLAAYLATGIGAGIVATPVAEAAIVTIDISGYGLNGPNAGLSPGLYTLKNDFPISGGGTICVNNNFGSWMGLYGYNGLLFAAGSNPASPVKFTLDQSIGSSANWSSSWTYPLFKYHGIESPDFGAGSYMGFQTVQGNYGWLQVTWAGATDTFQIYSGAYESVAGVPILAGDTVGGTSAVPEPGQVASSLLLLALGAAGVAIQRQRAKKKQQAEAVSLS
jgi:hypothetical protein